jgi:hypothetical protein
MTGKTPLQPRFNGRHPPPGLQKTIDKRREETNVRAAAATKRAALANEQRTDGKRKQMPNVVDSKKRKKTKIGSAVNMGRLDNETMSSGKENEENGKARF